MTQKNFYIKLIGSNIQVENDYRFKSHQKSDTEKICLACEALYKAIGLTTRNDSIEFFNEIAGKEKKSKEKESLHKKKQLKSFTYSDSNYRKLFPKKSGPDNIWVDIIELNKMQSKIKNNQKAEALNIIENYKETNNIFKFDILESVTKGIHYSSEIESMKINLRNLIINTNTPKTYFYPYFEKLRKLFDIDIDLLKNFYKEHLKDEHNKIKSLLKKIDKDNDQLELNADLEDYPTLRENYLKTDFSKIELKDKTGNIFIVDQLFDVFDGENNSLFTKKFLKFTNAQAITIIGSDGSGKGYIALAVCQGISQDNYSRFFINLSNFEQAEETLKNIDYSLEFKHSKPLFVIFHGLYLLVSEDLKKINIIVKKLLTNKSNYVIFTSENNPNFSDKILENPIISNSNILEINPYMPKDFPAFVNNIYLRLIYEKLKPSTETRRDLFYCYIEKTLSDIKYPSTYSKEKLNEDLKKIAYLVFKGQKVLKENYSSGFREIADKLKQIIFINNNKQGAITFTSSIIMDYFVANYLFSLSDPEELYEILKTSNINSYKWFSVTNFLAEMIESKVSEKQYFDIIAVVMRHLRQTKDLKLLNSIKHKLNSLNIEDINNDNLLLEIAKYYYVKSDYSESIKLSLKAMAINKNSEIFSHLASCFLDLYMPEYSLYFINKTDNPDDPRITGNKARALLRKDSINEAYDLFIQKHEKHIRNDAKFEILRDKSDLLFIKSIIEQFSDNKFSAIESEVKKIIRDYDEYNKDKDNNQEHNKAFVYCNVSYYLANADKAFGEEIIRLIKPFEEIEKDELKYLDIRYYINLGKYYFRYDKYKAKEVFKKAESLLESNTLHAESYLIYCYLYDLKGDSVYKEKTEKAYNSLKIQAEKAVLQINESKLFDEFSNDKFIFSDHLKEPDFIKKLNNFVIF